MYVSLLGISGALYLSVFEQPESRTLFSTLLKDKKVFDKVDSKREIWRCLSPQNRGKKEGMSMTKGS
jgi:hypothetical protein